MHFANGATGKLSASRIAVGHPNTLKFEVFLEQGALAFDVSRPGRRLKTAACPVPDAKAGLAKPLLMAVSLVATGRRWRC